MTIQPGDRLPHATLVKVTPDGPDQIATADYFAGRTVALFAVPGAFTPTCSAKHLPGFVEQAQALRDRTLTLLQLDQQIAEQTIALELLSGGPSEGWTR